MRNTKAERGVEMFVAQPKLLAFFCAALIVGLLFAAAEPAFAQCAMCKTAIENSTDAVAASRGLNLAALVLLIPPVAIFVGLFGVFYRYRNVQGR